MIQIDGLGYEQFLSAIEKRRLPFLQRMIQRDNFVLRKFYSGLPSTTPAVQAELFYGVKCSLPAFNYYDRLEEREKVMFDADAVDELAHKLEKNHRGLLRGGSSYSNIFAGGAAEAPFCIQSMSLESIFRNIKIRNTILIFIANIEKIVRIIGLSFLEMGLAIYDFFKGILLRKNPFKEFKFIFSRIGACIVLREMVRLHVKIDIARGLPIIHANFVGYDEHSHRRNPNSAFALWTLKGIDATIKDMVHKAVRSENRDYHVFIYSDHGQEATVPFVVEHGRTLREAIEVAFEEGPLKDCSFAEPESVIPHIRLHQRNKGFFRNSKRENGTSGAEESVADKKIHTTAMGPLGHIYLPINLDHEQMQEYADRLVQTAKIPLVFYRADDDVICVTGSGSGTLSQKAAEAFGEDHPLLQEVTRDMEILCRHRDAGEFIISGWRPQGAPLTFPIENGSHGGPGKNETQGFVIVPDILDVMDQPVLRALDLRRHVRSILRNGQPVMVPALKKGHQALQTIKVMSYNIHSCIGMDGKLFPERIARIISRLSPDIVALQEVDRKMSRTGNQDQASLLAEQLNMQRSYFPVLKGRNGEYGLAILSRFPLKVISCTYLPLVSNTAFTEKRGIMWIRIDTQNGPLHVLNTHLSLIKKERIVQMQYVIENIVDRIPLSEPVIFCGDFNAGVRSTVYTLLSKKLKDAQKIHSHFQPDPTFFSSYPLFTLDHIFYSDHLAPIEVAVVNDWECRLASDHLPVSGIFLHHPQIKK
ncbi:endonuclease/exonuclease/phosphatase family protein [Desulfopila inferna]|uniref:endonuclease/exonuclease/phosphatase family protein n=1 Tax=Desulfopila inferna TaxID=468528 RepID=UPI0019647BF4|nr:endonuclease/exonuclease/phosphatase family protein [Desulfopila inferna]MBM9604964.1 endonuclease/exonuclease/phosphatase family protein [Desulfopila inferna]